MQQAANHQHEQQRHCDERDGSPGFTSYPLGSLVHPASRVGNRNLPQAVQSWRSARMGSIRAARREGIQHATPATTISANTDIPNVRGSLGETS
jgi:hypothetical protein